MDKHAVNTHGQYLNVQGFKFCMFLGDRRDFSGSDKSEVAGVKTQDYPFSQVIR